MEVLILGGRPIREPVFHYGPFVMNSKSELIQALEDFNAGKFGTIPPNALMPHTCEPLDGYVSCVAAVRRVDQLQFADRCGDGDQRHRGRHRQIRRRRLRPAARARSSSLIGPTPGLRRAGRRADRISRRVKLQHLAHSRVRTDSGGGVGMSVIRSAAARTRIARLNARTIGARKSVSPLLSERYCRTASSATRDAASASWLSVASFVGASPRNAPRVILPHRRLAGTAAKMARAASTARDADAVAPLGHSSSDTITPTSAPTTTSSTRIRPTLHPVGTIRLKTISTIIVKAAWRRGERSDLGHVGRAEHDDGHQGPQHRSGRHPEHADEHGAEQEPDARADHGAQHPGAGGQRAAAQHRHRAEHHPEPVFHREQMRRPRRPGPARGRCAGCCAPPPSGWPRTRSSSDAAATVSGSSRSDAPVGGSRSPSARAQTGRASAAAAAAMIRPVAPMVAAMVRRLSSCRPSSTAASSSGAPRIATTSSR